MPRFNSVLIANRGEIACRIIRTAKQLGYRTIAVYSEADANARHVKLADTAVAIGPSPSTQSYLDGDKIIAAARETGAEAVHPGYGFLSENAEFSSSCTNAGLVFIGPTAEAIDVMGNKAQAKRKMIEAGVPCVPGYEGEDQTDDVLLSAADKVGFPIMVKAAAGGGGRGMRLVTEASELETAIKFARSEAQNAFGSGELILEKAVLAPRHVEVQVFADEMGNTIHLGERDCSIQRRHQKVVEEAPCPVMTSELREKMGAAAVAAARSISYVGAGTVEFLLDSTGEFYFLEMNTRLQVEHPVTELVTSLDLVALQLKVAQGGQLDLSQEDVVLSGHAIEVRLYTEDPANDFLPTSGNIERWKAAAGKGVRIDHGVESGQDISPFYDPMIAKVIAFGDDRDIARRRLLKALRETSLIGVKHNKYFLQACLEKPNFLQGEATTAFISDEFSSDDLEEKEASFVQCAIAAALDVELSYQEAQSNSLGVDAALKNWSSASPLMCRRAFEFEDSSYELNIICSKKHYSISSKVEPEFAVTVKIDQMYSDRASLTVDGAGHSVSYLWRSVGDIHIEFDSLQADFQDVLARSASGEGAEVTGQIRAPMHGQVLDVMVNKDQSVNKGDCLMVLEAMKMQHQILAGASGVVTAINVGEGEQVAAADIVIELEIDQD